MFNTNRLVARKDLGEVNLNKVRFWEASFLNHKIGFDFFPYTKLVPSFGYTIGPSEINLITISPRSKVISLGLGFKEGSFLTREKQLELHGVKIK